MPESNSSTARFSADAFGGTDFAKVDAHVIQPEEYDEIPELTDEMMARADVYVGDRLVRRGRSAETGAEAAEPLHLPPLILAHFRASGSGWQARIEKILLDAIERENAGR